MNNLECNYKIGYKVKWAIIEICEGTVKEIEKSSKQISVVYEQEKCKKLHVNFSFFDKDQFRKQIDIAISKLEEMRND